jgi:hypothetical protein
MLKLIVIDLWQTQNDYVNERREYILV